MPPAVCKVRSNAGQLDGSDCELLKDFAECERAKCPLLTAASMSEIRRTYGPTAAMLGLL